MEIDELKRKLRQLKKLEGRIRFTNSDPTSRMHYIWDEYFSLKNTDDSPAKYHLKKLLPMDREELKNAFDEYFYNVYYQYYRENGITGGGMYDTKLLSNLGLPPDASLDTIKHKFRELAKKYHPDLGGDSGKFIELMITYKKLTGDE